MGILLKLKCWFYTKLLYHYLKTNNKKGADKVLLKKINLLKSNGDSLG